MANDKDRGASALPVERPQTLDWDVILGIACELEASFDPGGNLPDDCAEWAETHMNIIGKLRGLAECALMDEDE